ncbi:YceI family protein [Myxococcota bacterium]|nr:YceI family protein [Myxococcota bacterium]
MPADTAPRSRARALVGGPLLALLLAALPFTARAAEEARMFSIDPEASRVDVQVGTAGMLAGLGHDHLVRVTGLTGQVRYVPDDIESSTVSFTVPTRGIRVVDPDRDPESRAEVQRDMEEKVLEVREYPEIRFRTVSIDAAQRTSRGWDLRIVGDLTLHGRTRRVEVPVSVEVDRDHLTARGTLEITHDQFGMERVSVALGTVKVANALEMDFALLARPVEGVGTGD